MTRTWCSSSCRGRILMDTTMLSLGFASEPDALPLPAPLPAPAPSTELLPAAPDGAPARRGVDADRAVRSSSDDCDDAVGGSNAGLGTVEARGLVMRLATRGESILTQCGRATLHTHGDVSRGQHKACRGRRRLLHVPHLNQTSNIERSRKGRVGNLASVQDPLATITLATRSTWSTLARSDARNARANDSVTVTLRSSDGSSGRRHTMARRSCVIRPRTQPASIRLDHCKGAPGPAPAPEPPVGLPATLRGGLNHNITSSRATASARLSRRAGSTCSSPVMSCRTSAHGWGTRLRSSSLNFAGEDVDQKGRLGVTMCHSTMPSDHASWQL